MDSLTQALLGATTFALVKDRKLGKKALWIGAAAGTLPDLDVLLSPFFSDVEFLLVHRGFSHSIFFAVLASIILGTLFQKYFFDAQSIRSWIWAFFLSIFTHPLLDVCTSYGTQLLNPLSNKLFSTHNIFVIEPIYTSILLIGVILLLASKSTHPHRLKIIQATLFLSCLYLVWTFTSQSLAKSQFASELKRQGIAYSDILVAPTPFNTLLWDAIVKTDSGYAFSDYSLLDTDEAIHFWTETNRTDLLPIIDTQRLVAIFLHYCDGYPLIKEDKNGLIKIYAAKYGFASISDTPKFLFPLVIDTSNFVDSALHTDQTVEIDDGAQVLRKLFRRVSGQKWNMSYSSK